MQTSFEKLKEKTGKCKLAGFSTRIVSILLMPVSENCRRF